MATKGPSQVANCDPITPSAPSLKVECHSQETPSQKCACSNTNASAKPVSPPPPPPTFHEYCAQLNRQSSPCQQSLCPPPAPGPPCIPPCRPCPCRKQKDCKYNFFKLLQPSKTKPKCKCYSPYAHLPFPICSWFASPKYFHLSSVRQCCKPKCLFLDDWKVGDFGNLSTNETLSEHEIRPSISTNTLHGIRSVNDLRAWSVCGEDQRRYFLEQMLKSRPVEAKEEILDELAREASPMQMRYENLISQKDEEIERLKKKVRELEGKRTEAPAKKASDTPPPQRKGSEPPPPRKKSGPTRSASRKNSEPPPSPPKKLSDPSRKVSAESPSSPQRKASEPPLSPSEKASELPGSPSGKASELPGSPSGKASELQRSPSGKASELQRSPSGKASELQRSPSGKASELPGSPSGKASELQRSPSGKTPELQRSPSGKASELQRSPSGKTSELQNSPSEKASQLPSSLSSQESESPSSPSRQPSELSPSPSRKASEPIDGTQSETSPAGEESDPSAPPPTEESESEFRPSPPRRASESSPASAEESEPSPTPPPSMNESGAVLPETSEPGAGTTSSPSKTESSSGEHESTSSLAGTESGPVAPGENEAISPPSRTESVANTPSAPGLSDQPPESDQLDAIGAFEEELFEDAEETVVIEDIVKDEATPPPPEEQVADTAQEEPLVSEIEAKASSAETAQAAGAAAGGDTHPPPSSSKSATGATSANVPNVANGMSNQTAAYHESTRRQDKKPLVCSSCEPQPPCLPCETTPESAYVCPSIHDGLQYPLENTFGYDTYIEVEGNRIKKMRDGMVVEEMEPETLVAELEWLRESMMANGQRVLDLEEALFHGNDFEGEDLYTACQLRSQVRLLRERLGALESQLGDKEAYERQLHTTLDETAMQLNQYRQEAERCRQCLADAEENVLQLRLRIMDLETGKDDDEQCYYEDPCQNEQEQQDIDEDLNFHVQMHSQNVECGYYG